MVKPKQILWLDDDLNMQKPLRRALEKKGYEIKALKFAIEAEDALRNNGAGFDLLILDTMIPGKDAKEEISYPASETDRGLETGLYFYKKNRELLRERNTPVLVFSQRGEQAVIDQYYANGLPFGAYQSKFGLDGNENFLAKIEDLIRK